jgi:peptidoglycan/xylan/chitin deacetylase (PgdA/CDA1 family)
VDSPDRPGNLWFRVLMSLTVDVEEIYHDLWPPGEARILEHYNYALPRGTFLKPLRRILELFDKYNVQSTFFVVGEVAAAFPEIVEEIHELGHEVASHGYMHQDLTKVPCDELEKRETQHRSLLAKLTGEAPKGFRAPNFQINTELLNLLERIGYRYDSSVAPSVRIPGWFGYYGAPLHPYNPSRQNLAKHSELRAFFEVPVAVFPYIRLPAGGGWFLRNLGVRYVKAAVRLLLGRGLPVILYLHPLDVDADVPNFEGLPFHVTRRCGEYALEAIEEILKTFRDCAKVPVREMLEELSGSSMGRSANRIANG